MIIPKIFTASLKNLLRKIDWQNTGLLVDGENMNHLRFVNGIALIVKDLSELQEVISNS